MINKAVNQIASRTAFAPLFKARRQNMQNVINDSVFFSMIKEPYLTYYNAFIKQWLEWSRGYVPQLHEKDFFSTGMGYTVCDIYSRECMSGGFHVVSENKKLNEFMEDWADLNEILSSMFFDANAGGNAILCLTPVNGELVPSEFPINRCVFKVNRNNKITSAMLFNCFQGGGNFWYTRESRVEKDGEFYYKVELAQGGLTTCPTFTNSARDKVPDEVMAQWEYSYGNIQPNKWYKMPISMHSIGLYNVKNKRSAVALSGLAGYSDSSLHTALDVLYSIDYNYTQQQIDQYLGKARALIPKQMAKAGINKIVNGVSFEEAINTPSQLEEIFYEQVIPNDSIDGKPIQPTLMQPELRVDQHKALRDCDLELLASKIGLSSTTLANHLTYNNSKTATEVRAEQDTTQISVNDKRMLATKPINALLKDVAEFYGFTDDIKIEWGRAGVVTHTEVVDLLTDYQNGTISLVDYIRLRFPTLTEEEVNEKAQYLEAHKPTQFGGIYNPSEL